MSEAFAKLSWMQVLGGVNGGGVGADNSGPVNALTMSFHKMRVPDVRCPAPFPHPDQSIVTHPCHRRPHLQIHELPQIGARVGALWRNKASSTPYASILPNV